MALTKEDIIKTVYGEGSHFVILGAGASIAATLLNPKFNLKQLPSMEYIVDLVGLSELSLK